MSILVDRDSRVLVQGITGREGAFHTTQMVEYGTNIVGQILGTSGEIGYMVTDISNELPAEVVDALARMEDTIRLRILR